MISNPATSAVNLITSAQFKAADAAHTIATFPVAKDEVGSAEFTSGDLFSPILSLKEAEIETSAAVKILKADNEMKGALFNAIA
ncbi:MAG: hypothetical protein L3J75_07165 [Methylococcaceae bacterium]|nr:hypothetical protein [Methylococcaceae bacterium]